MITVGRWETSACDRYAAVGTFHRAVSTVAVLTPVVVSLAGTTQPVSSRTTAPHDRISRRRHMPKLLSRTCQINYFTPCLCVYKGRSVRPGRASVCLCADFGHCPTMCLRKLCRVEFTTVAEVDSLDKQVNRYTLRCERVLDM